MASVFVSYARADRELVREIVTLLEQRGHVAWVDWNDIEPSDRWRESIRGAIDAADAVLAFLSPSSLQSAECAAEIAYAVEQRKRLVPLACASVKGLDVPAALGELSWIDVSAEANREAALAQLDRALRLDLELAQVHATVLTRARSWERSGRRRSGFLRGEELRSAERWLGRAAGGAEPQPTVLQQDFIAASRRDATRRQRRVVSGLGTVAVVASALAVFAFLQRAQARHEAAVAQSRELAARAEAVIASDPEDALSLAGEGVEIEPTRQAVNALAHALDASRLRGSLRAGGPVDALAFAPDGQGLLAGRVDGALRRWDGRDEQRDWTTPKGDAVGSVSYSRDGRLLLVVRSVNPPCSTEIRDARSGRLLRMLQQGTQPGDCGGLAQWIGATHTVGAIADLNLALIDADTGRRLRTITSARPAPPFTVFGLSIAADGRRAAVSGADGVIRVVRLADGRLVTTASPRSLKATTTAFSPDGTRLALGAQGGAEVIDLRYPDAYGGGHLQYQLRGSLSFVNDVAWSADGRFVAGATSDPATYVWDATSGRAVASLRSSTGFERAVAFSAEGMLASGGDDGFVRLWSPDPDAWSHRERVAPDGQLTEGYAAPAAQLVAFIQYDRLVVVDERGRLRVRRTIDPSVPHDVSADGAIGFAREDRIEVQQLVSGAGRRSLPLATTAGLHPTALALSADARAAAVVVGDQPYGVPAGPPGPLIISSPAGDHRMPGVLARSVAISPDGALAAAGDGDRIVVVASADRRVVHRLRGRLLRFMPVGDALLVLRSDTSIAVEDARSGRVRSVLRAVPPGARVGVSPDGRLAAAAGDDGTVSVWDVKDGTQLRTLHVMEQYARGGERIVVPAPAITAGGQLLVGVREHVLSYPACHACEPPDTLLDEARARLAAIRPR